MNKKCKFEKSVTINTSSVWIGDPMYVLSHERFANLPDIDGPIVLDGTEIGLVHGTFYGDGSYPGSKRKEYWVDTADLSIIDGKFANGDFLEGCELFNLEEGPHTITLIYERGTFTFKVDGKEIERIDTHC